MPPPDGPVVFDLTTMSHAVLAVDLVVNGEAIHFEGKVPLDLWDDMTPDKKADIALCTIYQGLSKIAERFADNVTVTRSEHPGATVLQLAGDELGRLLDRYGI